MASREATRIYQGVGMTESNEQQPGAVPLAGGGAWLPATPGQKSGSESTWPAPARAEMHEGGQSEPAGDRASTAGPSTPPSAGPVYQGWADPDAPATTGPAAAGWADAGTPP